MLLSSNLGQLAFQWFGWLVQLGSKFELEVILLDAAKTNEDVGRKESVPMAFRVVVGPKLFFSFLGWGEQIFFFGTATCLVRPLP